jgi:hypothetical protein
VIDIMETFDKVIDIMETFDKVIDIMETFDKVIHIMETFDKVMASKILINFMAFDKFIFDKVKKLI